MEWQRQLRLHGIVVFLYFVQRNVQITQTVFLRNIMLKMVVRIRTTVPQLDLCLRVTTTAQRQMIYVSRLTTAASLRCHRAKIGDPCNLQSLGKLCIPQLVGECLLEVAGYP